MNDFSNRVQIPTSWLKAECTKNVITIAARVFIFKFIIPHYISHALPKKPAHSLMSWIPVNALRFVCTSRALHGGTKVRVIIKINLPIGCARVLRRELPLVQLCLQLPENVAISPVLNNIFLLIRVRSEIIQFLGGTFRKRYLEKGSNIGL